MSHAEVIAAGQPCTKCHTRMGHRKQSYTQAMSPCITCHDTRTASAECTTCHSTDPLLATVSADSTETVGSGEMTYPAVRAANRNCARMSRHEEAVRSMPRRSPHASHARVQGRRARDQRGLRDEDQVLALSRSAGVRAGVPHFVRLGRAQCSRRRRRSGGSSIARPDGTPAASATVARRSAPTPSATAATTSRRRLCSRRSRSARVRPSPLPPDLLPPSLGTTSTWTSS